MEKETSVKVAVRVRPFIGIERVKQSKTIIQCPSSKEVLVSGSDAGPEKRFTFDFVYDQDSTQEAIYKETVTPLLKNYVKGYNATILAYGQTGSGKTFSMGTNTSDVSVMPLDENQGIIPRVINEIFELMSIDPEKEYQIKVSFMEIHNEQIRDLLAPLSSQKDSKEEIQLHIRENTKGEICVSNSIEETVGSAKEMLACLTRGSLCRSTGSTKMNATSSRSHAIFTVHLTQKISKASLNTSSSSLGGNDEMEKDLSVSSVNVMLDSSTDSLEIDKDPDEIICSKFHFVDLAGSERLKRTGATGQRMKEGININCGLLALGNVISALADKADHVPFRDSKITRMLQDSLGGNSQTVMLACVSPADSNTDESINTLRYANRARNIKNKPVINRDPNVEKMMRMRSRIRELEAVLAIQGGVVPSGESSATASVSTMELQLLREQTEVYDTEIQRLDEKLKVARRLNSEIGDKLASAQLESSVIKTKYHRLLKKTGSKEEVFSKSELSGLKELEEQRVENISLRQELAALKDASRRKDADTQRLLGKASNDQAQQRKSNSSGEDPLLGSIESLKDIVTDDPDVSEEIEIFSAIQNLKKREFEIQSSELVRVKENLDSEILEKQRLRKQLIQARAHNNVLTSTYSSKIVQAEAAASSVESQRDELIRLLEQKTKNNPGDVSGKLKAKIKKLELQLKQYKQNIKENRALQSKLSTEERRIARYEEDICRAKQQRVKLAQQISEKASAFQAWKKQKENKIKAMVKQARLLQIKMGKLQATSAKQALVIKRNQEQKKALQAKLERQQKLTQQAQNSKKRTALGLASVKTKMVKHGGLKRKPETKSRFGLSSFSSTNKRIIPSSADSLTSQKIAKTRKPAVPSRYVSKKLSRPSSDKENKPPANSASKLRRPLSSDKETKLARKNSKPSSRFSNNTTKTTLKTKPSNEPAKFARGSQNITKMRGGHEEIFQDSASLELCGKVDISSNVTRMEIQLLTTLQTGTMKELCTLNQIGKKRAEAIIEARFDADKEVQDMDLKELLAIGGLKGEKAVTEFMKRNVMDSIWGDNIDMLESR